MMSFLDIDYFTSRNSVLVKTEYSYFNLFKLVPYHHRDKTNSILFNKVDTCFTLDYSHMNL